MRLIRPSYEIMQATSDAGQSYLALIETAARTCYKSEHKADSDRHTFIRDIINKGHESVIEHSMLSVKFVCDRGISHELVRHRLCAFSQESTRFCNYRGGVTFVIPVWLRNVIKEGEYSGSSCYNIKADPNSAALIWIQSMAAAENDYRDLLDLGWSPQQARSVLPNSLKTEVIVTANFREWRHIFKLRTAPAAHPQMRELMIPLLEQCKDLIPTIFDTI